MRSSWLGLHSLLLVAACGASPLAPQFAPPSSPSASAVAANLMHAEAREERPVIVALCADGGTLCAWDLGGKALWEVRVQAKSAPLVVGDSVVVQEADGIAVRALSTGERRVSLDTAASLVGADGIGSALVLSLVYQEQGSAARGELVFISDRSVRWEKALSQPVGIPALSNNHVLVPWGTQRLSLLSAADGSELARLQFHNLMVGQALVDRGRVYVGQLGLLPVDQKLPEHQEGTLSLITPHKRVLPGQPPLLRDGYSPVPPAGHASHKIKLEWRAGEQGVEAGALVLRFYRMAFGLAAERDEVRWVRVFEHDLVGSSAQAGGAFLVDDHGSLRFVDANGATRMRVELKKTLQAATIRPGSSYQLPAAAAGDKAGQALELPGGSLHDQLLSAAELEDDRLFPARAFAVQHLAKTDDPGVTRELIAICSRKSANNGQALSACDELGKRTGNARDILDGLRQKASFLEQTAAPPVGALAQAAARSELKEAGPLILAHAEDPNTSSKDLAALFQALGQLDYQPAITQLERFVRLHHAEPAGSDLAPALTSALSVLGELRAKLVRSTLASVAADELTLEPVRLKAKEALSVLDTPKTKSEPAKPPAAPLKAKQAVKPEVLTDPRPHALDAEAVQKTFRPLYGALQRCLESDPAKPKSARIAMIVAGDGSMEGFFVTPTSLQGCSDAILRTARFPATRLSRQHVHHTVYAADPDATTGPLDAKPVSTAKAPSAKPAKP